MSIRERVASVLSFRTLPVTVLTVVVYAAIYFATAITDDLPSVPATKDQHGLNVDQAYDDLHKIAGLPHPYNSHQNDVVRSYILERVHTIASYTHFVAVDDDNTSNATFGPKSSLGNDAGVATYFEGSNVLVKVDGVRPVSELGAVLFSAHFDSVSTAPGATDDGMGVATLLALVECFAKNRPKRTVVFNINNGEEDGLYGAHAFLEHPWSKLTKDFINLEGAGAGGRPLLLRATSTRIARAWRQVPHPHGLVISADAFARGAIRSSTDYSVYTAAGLGGLDFSFYRQRSKYHTRDDSIPSLGGKSALWNMMESTLLAGLAIVNDEGTEADYKSLPVYFDLFGETLAVATLETFYGINIALLVVGPIIVAALIFLAHRKQKLYWPIKGWGRTLAALVIGSGLTIGLGMMYVHVNPFIVYSSNTTVLMSTLSLAFLSFYTISELFSLFLPIPQQRSMAFLECYIFWWILLIVDTAYIGRDKIGGLYFITFFHAGALAALLVGLLEHLELPSALGGRSGVAPATVANDHEGDESDPERSGSSERTPLLAQHGRTIRKSEINGDNEKGLWVIQFLLAVPFPVILITQISIMLLNALSQALADGNSATTVYLAASVASVLSFIPLLPFIHKLHRVLPLVLVLVLAASVLYSALAFPFSVDAPLKVFFQQTIDLDSGANTVRLTGAHPWLDTRIVPELPSSWDSNTTCEAHDSLRGGLPTCTWSGLPPHVATSNSSSKWLEVNATQTAPGMGLLSIAGIGTRNCRVYFSRPASTISVRGGSGLAHEGFPVPDNVEELRLWSRTWERTFEVSLAWNASDADGEENGIAGRIACEWAESGGLPAFEEVLAFLPRWARVTKRTDGLLEGYKTFSIG
ncbi:hypothetical protein EW145_g2012 [Phellinidium pouzarii]|uniref:Peptide hydrolase n=1 Tax=Phellinidium pouzarii TaxID=167371 RepID=A0A4S4LCG3_9AGAM|nr:hypothetical protein EW145_g2012 [Phellinidium pouzarii]